MQGFGMLLASVLALFLVHVGLSLEARDKIISGRNNDTSGNSGIAA